MSHPHEVRDSMAAAAEIRALKRQDLRTGDILLARGSARLGSLMSDLICELDGGSYSHVALWEGDSVLEASGDGGKVRSSHLEQLITEHEYTHVYRFSDTECAPSALDCVANVARGYVGSSYPYPELCLIGVMIALGRATGLPQAQAVLRRVGGELSRFLQPGAQALAQARMTCAQYVCQAFWEADPSPARSLALRVLYPPGAWMRSAPAASETPSGEWLELVRACERAFLAAGDPRRAPWSRDPARGHRGSRAIGVGSLVVRAGDRALPLHCVTPRDLEHSPSLTLLGALS